MVEVIFSIMAISLLLYILLGGADFGGGILELALRGNDKGLVAKAIAPVWEANHVWLILVVVILFVGFPPVYSVILTVFHIPVLLALLGIILRGSAFTFRHYDIEEEKPQKIYTIIFRYSSLMTTFFLGMIVGGIILGEVTIDYSRGFYEVYIHPWLNWFCVVFGIFLVMLFTFLANIYTISEIREQSQINRFSKTARYLIALLVITGGLVFVTAELYGHRLLQEFLSSPVSITCIVLATLALPLLWINLDKNKPNLLRLIAGFQTTMIVAGWFAIQLPVVVQVEDAEDITLYNSAAPAETQYYMLIALVVGVLIIFPSMGYLYKTFKFSGKTQNHP